MQLSMPNSTELLQLTEEQTNNKLKSALTTLLEGQDLSYQQMYEVMLLIMNGKCSDALMSAILIALRIKGESIDEITAGASVMRQLSLKVSVKSPENLVDIVGTGGDGSHLFNVSTASAMVVACTDAQVAKHGNRGVSSRSGSSDLLDMAGVRLDLTPEQTLACIEQQSLGFLFAPNHHPAIRHAMPVRRALGVRTLFNILGPLTNPAGAKKAVIGVFDKKLCEPLAHVFAKLGDLHVMVVGSDDGLDEISLASSTHVAELKDGTVSTYALKPEDIGINSRSLEGLQVQSSAESLKIIRLALTGKSDNEQIKKAQDMIALNAGAAIYVAGCAKNLQEGVKKAKEIIMCGQALTKLESLAKFSNEL